jgi:hypothetical protein
MVIFFLSETAAPPVAGLAAGELASNADLVASIIAALLLGGCDHHVGRLYEGRAAARNPAIRRRNST